MKVVKSNLSILLTIGTVLLMTSLSAFATQQTGDSNAELGNMFLFAAGSVGLLAARRHMKQNAS